MMTKNDYLIQYQKLPNVELLKMFVTIDDYVPEAKEALEIEILQRGGIEYLKNEYKQTQKIKNEEDRISGEAAKLYIENSDPSLLYKMITSELLSKEKVHELIDAKLIQLKKEEEDQKIKPRTVFGSIIGILIASIIGGTLWGLQLIQMHRMFVIFGFGLVLLCYGVIRLLTKQSKANKVVLIATIISTVIAFIFGQFLFELFG